MTINIALVIGRITKTPELRQTKHLKSYTLFQIANHSYNKVNYINCIAWNSTAEFIVNYIGKGSMIGIEGSLQSNAAMNNCIQIHIKYLRIFIKKSEFVKMPEQEYIQVIEIDDLDLEL